MDIINLPYYGKHPERMNRGVVELSIEQMPSVLAEAEQMPRDQMTPLDVLIALEAELGCSIVQALRIYRDHLKS